MPKDDYQRSSLASEREYSGTAPGITFHTKARRWFSPYSWLLFAELNQDETKLHFRYTHATVTLTGAKLAPVLEAAARFQLHTVRESPSAFPVEGTAVTAIEITENAPSSVRETARPKPYELTRRGPRSAIDLKYFESRYPMPSAHTQGSERTL